MATTGVIDDATPTLTGTLSGPLTAGQVVAIYDGTTLLATAVVDGLSWRATLSDDVALSAGSYTLTARVLNLGSGEQGTVSNTFAFSVQKVAIASITDDVGGISGNVLSAANSSQYVRISQQGVLSENINDNSIRVGYSHGPTFDIAEVQVWAWVDGDLVNVAAGQTVSSRYAAAEGSSAGALTDGSGVTGYEASLGSVDNWLQIDLGQAYDIVEVVVIPRSADGNIFATHAANAVVSTSATDLSALTTAEVLADNGVSSQVIEGTPDTIGESIQFATRFATDDTAPVLAGTLAVELAAGQVVAIYDNDVYLGTATISNGTDWSFSVSALSTGSHDLVARVEDASGNVIASTASGSVILNVDTATPTQLVAINEVVDNVAAYTATDNLVSGISTNDAYLDISGSVSAPLTGAQVIAIYDGSTRLGEALVTDSQWTFTTAELAAGSHTFTARVENPATGTNGSVSATGFTVIKQSVSVSSISDDVGGITTDLLSSTNNVEAARYVRVSNGNLAELEVWATVDGTLTNVALNATVTSELMSATDLTYLVDGNGDTNSVSEGWLQIDLGQAYVIHNIVAVPRISDGSFRAETVNATVSTSLFDLSALSSDALDALSGNTDITTKDITGNDVGVPANVAWTTSYQTDDAALVFTGKLGAALAPTEVLGVYNGDVRIGQGTVTGTDWTFTPTTALAAGTYMLRLQVEDAASGTASTGRASSTVFTVTIDDTIPTASVTIATATDDAGASTGVIVPNGLTDDVTATLNGTVNTSLSANQRVAIYDGSTFLGTADVTGTEWTFTPFTALSAGNHSFTAVVENTATGIAGTPSTATTLSIQQLNVLAITDNVGLLQGNILERTSSIDDGSPLGNTSQTNDTSLTYSGTLAAALEAEQSVKVYDSGVLLGTATVTGTQWSFAAPETTYATHALSFQIESDSAPGVSLLSTELTVNVNFDDPGFTLLALGNTLNIGGVDRHLDLTQVSGLDQRIVQTFNLDNIAGITSGEGTNRLTLDIDDVLISGADLFNSANGFDGLDSEGRRQVRVDGDSGTVNVEGSGWVAAGTTSYEGNDYVVYNFGTTGQLLVDTDLGREGAIL